MIPVGFQLRTHVASRGGWISEYTRASRTRRAMSCVNCEPKSRIRMRDVTPSVFPLRSVQRQELHLLGVEIEQCGARRAIQPSATLAGAHDQRITLRLHVLFV